MKIMFRSLGLVAVLALSTLLPSCDKVKDAVRINIPTQTVNADFSIQKVGAGTAQETYFQWGVNLDSVIKKSNPDLGIKNIKKAKVKSIILKLNNATQADNWANFSAAEAGFSTNLTGGNYIAFASVTNNADAYATTLDIPVKDIDVKEYLGSSVLTYKLSATARRATTATLNGTATIQLDVEVGF